MVVIGGSQVVDDGAARVLCLEVISFPEAIASNLHAQEALAGTGERWRVGVGRGGYLLLRDQSQGALAGSYARRRLRWALVVG